MYQVGASVTITISGDVVVKSLNSSNSIVLSPNTTLRLTSSTSTISGNFLAERAELRIEGTGTQFSALGSANINAGSLIATDGAKILLPTVSSYSLLAAQSLVAVIRSEGSDSLIELPNVTAVTGSTEPYTNLKVESLAGGRVNMSRLNSVTDPAVGNTDRRAIRFSSDGSNSLIDLSQLTTIIDLDPGYAFDGNRASYSGLSVSNSGTILVPALTSVSNTDINIDATGVMLLPALTTATSSRITVLGNRSMPLLVNAANSTFTLAGSSLSVPQLSNIDGASVYVSNGTVFSLPSVASYTLGTVSGLFAVLRATGVAARLICRTLQVSLVAPIGTPTST